MPQARIHPYPSLLMIYMCHHHLLKTALASVSVCTPLHEKHLRPFASLARRPMGHCLPWPKRENVPKQCLKLKGCTRSIKSTKIAECHCISQRLHFHSTMLFLCHACVIFLFWFLHCIHPRKQLQSARQLKLRLTMTTNTLLWNVTKTMFFAFS